MASTNKFVQDQDYIYINSLYAEAYISESLFQKSEQENAIVREYGDGIQAIGVFAMRFFDTEEYDREKTKIDIVKYPNVIDTYPTKYFREKLVINGVEDTYRVLLYEKGDIFMPSVVDENPLNCENFIDFLISGKLPHNIKYNDVYELWLKNFKINGITPPVPGTTLQMIIAKLYRQKDDLTAEFRLVAGTGKVSMIDYQTSNPRQITMNSSVLAGLGFEDFGDALASALLISKRGTKQKLSPVEEVILK